ncbi:glycosyltransferase family 2 protein [Cobetia sp. L2A1]|uniref:glycosyltransferase family 2 protein n=1 Tax=Cobetia sp. L2A1 TaxID=2686360 RepID=UPI00131A63B9|nr:glycosyltransferase family 2 protein [Cobetia sp. L2A1]
MTNRFKKNKPSLIYAVIVTYNPDVARVKEMVKTLSSLELRVIVVDNTESPDKALSFACSEAIALGYNSGIAHAQNIGIAQALKDDADAIIFFDQDSRIDELMIKQLTLALDVPSPLIVAPVFYDEKNNFEYPAILVDQYGFRKKIYPSFCHHPVSVDIVISSGTMANRQALERVGLMNESLFIDYVDTEWCLRARSLGVPIKVIPGAVMLHSIGDNSLDLKFFKVPVHSPARRYYRVRNSFYLLGMKHVPNLLAMREIVFAFIHQIVILCAVPGRREYLRFFYKALKDVVCKKKGKISL